MPPVIPTNRKSVAKTARRNRRWLQRGVSQRDCLSTKRACRLLVIIDLIDKTSARQ